MWTVVLKILSILGIILLCLLALLLVTLLLVLFWPVSYRGGGSAGAGEYRAWFRFRWLFGLVRGAYAYPESKGLQIKVLWLTVYDSGGKQEEKTSEDTSEEKRQSGQTLLKQAMAEPEGQTLSEQAMAEPEGQILPEQTVAEAEGQTSLGQAVEADGDGNGAKARTKAPSESSTEAASDSEKKNQDTGEQTRANQNHPLPEKLSGLKEELLFYLEIVRDKDNQELVKYGLTRLGKILKSMRPRFLQAEALAGLGEPDLTGYVYGVYWAVKPFLGKKCQVTVTPDFDRRILEGEARLGGRIMAVVLVHNVIRVLLDKRLRQLMRRLRKAR